MATLTVFKFDTPEGADQAEMVVNNLQQQNLIVVQDWAVVSWPAGAKKPTTKQGRGPVARRSLDGTFWGMLFGLIFFMPLIGAAVGAAVGAVSGVLSHVGIDDDFIKETRAQVTEGTSAIFLMTTNEVGDRITESFKQLPPHTLIASNLSDEGEAKLKEHFGA